MQQFAKVAIFGATGGIGNALCQQAIAQGCTTLYRVCRHPDKLSDLPKSTTYGEVNRVDIQLDLSHPEEIATVLAQYPELEQVDLVLIATGWLHDAQFTPEKTYRHLNATAMQKSFLLNTIAPSLIIQAILNARSKRAEPLKIGVLSARVGSISDNKMGGWHSYRASKAALNMMIKNYAIELQRMRAKVIIVGLQPGTTDSQLSKPFQKHLKAGQLQTPSWTATRLLDVMHHLNEQHNGELIDFEGHLIAP